MNIKAALLFYEGNPQVEKSTENLAFLTEHLWMSQNKLHTFALN